MSSSPENKSDRAQCESLFNKVTEGDLEALQKHLEDNPLMSLKCKSEKHLCRTPLMEAIYQSKPDVANYLVSAGADINCTGVFLQTPLHAAVISNNLSIVQALLKAGCNLDARDNCERTPLILSAQANNLAIVEELLDSGAKVDARDHSGMDLAMFASAYNNLGILKCIYSRHPVYLRRNVRNLAGWTAIMFAVRENLLDVVKFLDKAGVDLQARDAVGMNLAHIACFLNGSYPPGKDMTDLLLFLREKVDFEDMDDCGNRPLDLAITSGNLNTVKVLLHRCKVNTEGAALALERAHLTCRHTNLLKMKRFLEEVGAIPLSTSSAY